MSNLKLSKNSNTSKETLDKLSNDEYYGVRWRVANNPNTSKETLSNILVNETDEDVIDAILENPNTPEEIIAIYEVHST